jgi:hemerythrin superfamily protein
MPTSKKTGSPLALEMLMTDHEAVKKLFKQYDKQKDADDASRQETAERICNELTVHAEVEEELFYPWLRENLAEDDMELVEEAGIEHQTAKDLIAQLEDAEELDGEYDAKVKVLSEYIDHHVGEEENEIFPKVKSKKDELDALGEEMMARKVELKAEIGMEDEEEPAGRKKDMDAPSQPRTR